MIHHPSQMGNFRTRVPDGDNRDRLVCDNCGLIHYDNPRIVVGSLVTYEDKYLLCKRAIEPRYGYWTHPAGFMEEQETTEEGAKREAHEEACIDIVIDGLLAIYNIPRISQVQIFYKAHLETPDFGPGPESLEVVLFDWDDIPWKELAFPTVYWALKQSREVMGQAVFAPFTNPEGETVSAVPKRD